MDLTKVDRYLELWTESESTATRMLSILNILRTERGVLVHVYGRSIAKVSTTDILKVHRHARLVMGRELTVQDTYPVIQAVGKLDLGPCRIDLGKLTVKFQNIDGDVNLDDFVASELESVSTGVIQVLSEPRDVVLYGFGRIGRLVARVLLDKVGRGDKLRPKAIVVRKTDLADLKKRTALLRLDSVHGTFPGTIQIDEEENAIVANGNMMRIIAADGPDKVDYTKYGINNAIVVDNTGMWRDREGLEQHLKSKGVDKVLLTAPGKGDIPNIVHGVNHHTLSDDEKIVSAASCTTNAIAPILDVINKKFGVVSGHIESCHAYTNDQNLIDNYHKSPRRGRAAAMNMVITSTGAAKAVAIVLPELKGKLTGNAIRVPTPNVSLAILKLTLAKETTVNELNETLRRMSLNSPLQNQIDYTNSSDIVSCDIVGSRHAGVVDGQATIVNEAQPTNVVLYIWYDNEFGYTCQLMRVIQQMAGINLAELP
jgi:glyceraldehyde 3-phosphate dehydrogenase